MSSDVEINYRFKLEKVNHGMRRFTVLCRDTTMFSIIINEQESTQLERLKK